MHVFEFDPSQSPSPPPRRRKARVEWRGTDHMTAIYIYLISLTHMLSLYISQCFNCGRFRAVIHSASSNPSPLFTFFQSIPALHQSPSICWRGDPRADPFGASEVGEPYDGQLSPAVRRGLGSWLVPPWSWGS